MTRSGPLTPSILRLLQAAALGALIVPTPLHAEPLTLVLDRAASQIVFNLPDPLHKVEGTFPLRSGTVRFDPTSNEMSGLIVVDAAGGRSGSAARDRRMTDDELRAGSYATITFAPQRRSGAIAVSGDSDVIVDGIFTLLGTPHPLRVPMHLHAEGARMRATGTFPVPYVQWGLKDPSVLLLRVAKEVTITLTLVGTVTATPTTATPTTATPTTTTPTGSAGTGASQP